MDSIGSGGSSGSGGRAGWHRGDGDSRHDGLIQSPFESAGVPSSPGPAQAPGAADPWEVPLDNWGMPLGGATVVHLANVTRHKDSDVWFAAPLEDRRIAVALYHKGVALLRKLGGGEDLLRLCAAKPPCNFAPLFNPPAKRQGIYTQGEVNRGRNDSMTWLPETHCDPSLAPHHKRGMADSEGLYRWCGYLAVWERKLAAQDLPDEGHSDSLGHLNVCIWNSGRFRGVSRTHELFRTGVSNLLLAQEFDDDGTEQAHALERLGFNHIQDNGCMVAVRRRHCAELTQLWTSDDKRLAAIIARVTFRPCLWSENHTLVVASIHLHNVEPQRSSPPSPSLSRGGGCSSGHPCERLRARLPGPLWAGWGGGNGVGWCAAGVG